MKHEQATLEKGNIKLTEFSEPTFTHFDKLFVQIGCCGLYANRQELKDLLTVINYYLNADDITDIKVRIGGDYVTL